VTKEQAADASQVRVTHDGPVTVVTLSRPEVRNAVDGPTARALGAAFTAFEKDDRARVAVFHGAHGTFCAGADLKAVASAEGAGQLRPPGAGEAYDPLDTTAPMGPTRMQLSKPVIAAVSGYAVAGGMELALWCDMRVMEESATFGIFCRRWGVPLIDGGTVRLPRLIGHSRAMDLILTGRPVDAAEALQMGLANRVVPDGQAVAEAVKIAHQIAAFPQGCLRSDRRSAYEQWDYPFAEAMAHEFATGEAVIRSGETRAGAKRFAAGKGRRGDFGDI
jgi:enoyl-CoA hydratase